MAKVIRRKAKPGETFLGGKGVVIFINPCRNPKSSPDPETERLEREMEESVPHRFGVDTGEDES